MNLNKVFFSMYLLLHPIIHLQQKFHPFQIYLSLLHTFINYIFPANKILIYNSLFLYDIYILILIMLYSRRYIFEGENIFNFTDICCFHWDNSWCRTCIWPRNIPIFHPVWLQKLFRHIDLLCHLHNNVFNHSQYKYKIQIELL